MTDYTAQVQAIVDAANQVDTLTQAALATDAANNAMNAALRLARQSLADAQAALLAPSASVAATPEPAATPGT